MVNSYCRCIERAAKAEEDVRQLVLYRNNKAVNKGANTKKKVVEEALIDIKLLYKTIK